MTEHSVVVAGGGPAGLMLAGELALAKIDVVIVEPRTNQFVDESRAGGLHARTIEVLDQRGIAERFLSEGQTYPAVAFGGIPLDIGDLPTRHNYLLALWQSAFEPIWLTGLKNSGCRSFEALMLWASLRTTRVSMSRCPTARHCERSISSAATEGAAWCAKRPGSTSSDWIPQPADDRRSRDGR